MASNTHSPRSVPRWLLRPLPPSAVVDAQLHQKIDELAEKLPDSLFTVSKELTKVQSDLRYDAAANRAAAHVWGNLDRFIKSESSHMRDLLRFAAEHMVPRAQARLLRRFSKDADPSVRSLAKRMTERSWIREVALPIEKDGPWDQSGWSRGVGREISFTHAHGARVQQRLELPRLETISQLRELLKIRSSRQLGFFLRATHRDDGPYTQFFLDKKDGGQRMICAPQPQLLWVQRRILRHILEKVPPHRAAHGFVRGRSTVTNAAPHLGAKLLLKFDLHDFFPSIHYWRVVGLFSSLGYGVDDGRFRAGDSHHCVAPTLARLCCYTSDQESTTGSFTPQGAPTSPAISNLVCRGLDARLEGLARKTKGRYTRYADDLTFSFKGGDLNVGRFRWWVDQICHQEGFLVHQKKFRAIRRSQRQTVTGVVVNDVLRIPRAERRKFRAILHNCRQQGVDSQARGNPAFRSYLRGFVSYLRMVHPEEGVELTRQVNELIGAEK